MSKSLEVYEDKCEGIDDDTYELARKLVITQSAHVTGVTAQGGCVVQIGPLVTDKTEVPDRDKLLLAIKCIKEGKGKKKITTRGVNYQKPIVKPQTQPDGRIGVLAVGAAVVAGGLLILSFCESQNKAPHDVLDGSSEPGRPGQIFLQNAVRKW